MILHYRHPKYCIYLINQLADSDQNFVTPKSRDNRTSNHKLPAKQISNPMSKFEKCTEIQTDQTLVSEKNKHKRKRKKKHRPFSAAKG